MSINLNELLSILGGVSFVLSAVYAVGSKISALNSKVEHHEYLINDFYNQLSHKSQRLLGEIKELEVKLEKLAEKL